MASAQKKPTQNLCFKRLYKMLIIDFYKIPIGYALLVTASIIAISMIASALKPSKTHGKKH